MKALHNERRMTGWIRCVTLQDSDMLQNFHKQISHYGMRLHSLRQELLSPANYHSHYKRGRSVAIINMYAFLKQIQFLGIILPGTFLVVLWTVDIEIAPHYTSISHFRRSTQADWGYTLCLGTPRQWWWCKDKYLSFAFPLREIPLGDQPLKLFNKSTTFTLAHVSIFECVLKTS